MSDHRIENFAKILVEYSANIQPGDRVEIQTTLAALPLVKELYKKVLDRGGYPYPALSWEGQMADHFEHANDLQLGHTNDIRKYVYDNFESRFRIAASTDLHELKDVAPERQAIDGKAKGPVLETQMRRGAEGEFKWVSSLYPTQAYADQAGMTLTEFEDFVFSAVFADKEDPIAEWEKFRDTQANLINNIHGKEKVVLRGPNVDLSLSVKDRVFINCAGTNNMPDGEIFTGPVEESLNGWVKYTYPAIIQGRVVEGIELNFENGKVIKATSDTNEEFLLQMIGSDEGASYVGEFAIGTNYGIQQFTGSILFDEKIGGSFHMALGAGYPETGSLNKSQIHWDMICDLRNDSEILMDDELVYKDGKFVI